MVPQVLICTPDSTTQATSAPQEDRGTGEDGPTVVPPEKVLAVHRALAEAGLPHAIGGAIALSIYGAPRDTVDIDVNVFVAAERRPEVRAALDRPVWPLDGNPVHVFYSHDPLHEEMAKASPRGPLRRRRRSPSSLPSTW